MWSLGPLYISHCIFLLKHQPRAYCTRLPGLKYSFWKIAGLRPAIFSGTPRNFDWNSEILSIGGQGSPPWGVLGTKGIKLLLLCYSGPLKSKKSFLFHLLPVTLRKTVEKPDFAKILRFLVEKGGSQAGVYPISTLRVSMDTPAFDPPFFNSENAKLPLNWVFQLLSATVTVKQVNKELFLNTFKLIRKSH